jgi:hypothetical protein
MIKGLVECEECLKHVPADEIEICGDWLGAPGNGYACPDRLCADCRTGGGDAD